MRTIRKHTGRGPTKARTFVNDDVVTVVLQDTLSTGERNLMRDGERDVVRAIRSAYKRIMRPELIAGIEAILQRKVVASLSDNHIEADFAVEVFILAPSLTDGESG